MNKIKLFNIFFVILLFSCTKSNEPIIISVDYQDEAMFFGALKIEFDIHLESINNSETLIRKLIYDNKNFDEYIEYRKNEFIGSPDREIYQPEGNESGYIYNYELNVKYNVLYNCDLYVIIKHSEYYYTGGAHGNYWTMYYIIDLKEERIMDLDDLVNQIPDNILKDTIASTHNIVRFLSDEIWPPDSINTNNGKIELIWNVYSITPYSDGLINIIIPDLTVQQYLTDKGKEIIMLTKRGNNV